MVLPAGGITTFNIHHGYVEALVRGYRSGYLDDVDYHHLTQCETLEGKGSLYPFARGKRPFACAGRRVRFPLLAYSSPCGMRMADVKLNLQETDYDQFLQDEVRFALVSLTCELLVCTIWHGV